MITSRFKSFFDNNNDSSANWYQFEYPNNIIVGMNEGSTGDSHEFDNGQTSGQKGNPGDSEKDDED